MSAHVLLNSFISFSQYNEFDKFNNTMSLINSIIQEHEC